MKRHIAGLLLLVAAAPCLFAGGDLEKAVELRKTEQFRDAELLLKKYASPAQFESLSPAEKIEFLRCTLELAHIRALKDDVPGALALLNWAEGRPDPYQRAISCLKYAEILLDIGEMERASAYLKDADKIIAGQYYYRDILTGKEKLLVADDRLDGDKDDRFEIFSYVAYSHSHALGVGEIIGKNNFDLEKNIFKNHPNKCEKEDSHLYHSWQFLQSFPETQEYWLQFIKDVSKKGKAFRIRNEYFFEHIK